MRGDIEMSPAEEDLRDAMKDEAAFDLVPLRLSVHPTEEEK